MSNLILKTVQGTAQADSQPAFKHGEAELKPGFFKFCWKSTIFTWRRAYQLFSDAVDGKVLGRLFYLELNLIWIPMRDRLDISYFPQQPDHKPPSFRPPSFTLHGHWFLPLTCSLGLLCHLPARLFVLSSSSTLFVSLAGHWFGFAIPSLSLGGASVVAEENRYPFYVFIISQIKKLMN